MAVNWDCYRRDSQELIENLQKTCKVIFIVYQYKKKVLIYNTFSEVGEAQNRRASQVKEGLSVVQIIIKEIKNDKNNAAQDT